MKNFIIFLSLFCCFVHAEWITVFNHSHASTDPVVYNIPGNILNETFSQLRYYTVDGRSATLDAYLPNSTLQAHINQSWLYAGYESDYYKRLSVDTGSKTTSLFIGNDHDLAHFSGSQLSYAGTPFGLITLGANESASFIDCGDSVYYYGCMVYRLDINTVPEPSSLLFLSIALLFFIKKW